MLEGGTQPAFLPHGEALSLLTTELGHPSWHPRAPGHSPTGHAPCSSSFSFQSLPENESGRRAVSLCLWERHRPTHGQRSPLPEAPEGADHPLLNGMLWVVLPPPGQLLLLCFPANS